jgi:hypothetical protein
VPEGYVRVVVTTLDGVKSYHTAPTLELLREQGYRVIIQHRRYPSHKVWRTPSSLARLGIITKAPVNAKGGTTHVILLGPEGSGWSEGHAVCVAKDPYSKRIGYVLAVEKALEKLDKY